MKDFIDYIATAFIAIKNDYLNNFVSFDVPILGAKVTKHEFHFDIKVTIFLQIKIYAFRKVAYVFLRSTQRFIR